MSIHSAVPIHAPAQRSRTLPCRPEVCFLNVERWKRLDYSCVQATVELYRAVVQELLPTPTKSHYLFNTRDLARIIQGTTRASKSFYDTKESMLTLWVRIGQQKCIHACCVCESSHTSATTVQIDACTAHHQSIELSSDVRDRMCSKLSPKGLCRFMRRSVS